MAVGSGSVGVLCGPGSVTDEEEDERLTFPDVTKEKLGFGDETDKNCESNMIKERLFYSRKKFTGLLVACVIF